uniref:Sushi domain-containing protein n=1 Tax=Scleropages formosus TaxID=113540 RepID=A0A8D0CNG2_SCLFO
MFSVVTAPDCPPPPRVEYGLIVGEYQRVYRQHSQVTYACHEMYKIKGNGVIRCIDGHWSELPTCLKPCQIPTRIDAWHNIEHIEGSLLKHGDTTYVYCKHGFRSYTDQSYQHYGVGKCNDGEITYPLCK